MQKIRKALVLGCGRSGQAAEALLHSEGTEVLSLDESISDFQNFKLQLSDFRPSIAIISPGFSVDHPWVKELVTQGIPLLSEVELGWSRRKCPVIAVTGSNGKSTVVKWIADTLKKAGQIGIPCGNYGFPVSAAVLAEKTPDWLVIEVSSFQLETTDQFRPEIGVLLNVLPNHLDRHGDMETYQALKFRLFERMTDSDTAIWPFAFCRAEAEPPPRSVSVKSFGIEADADFQFEKGRVGDVDLSNTYFDNEVLGSSSAAVVAVCSACGLSAEVLEGAAREFEPLPHRMQTVAIINGVRFIDDSKATNLAAMCAALRMSKGRVHLIAGGRAKETNLSFAKDLLVQQVSRLYLIGEALVTMQEEWGDFVECLPCETLEKAVFIAWERATPGDTILLSPACTSFDQFRSFSERGDVFAREVNQLADATPRVISE